MWTVVYMTQSREVALSAQRLLESSGILVIFRFLCCDDESSECCELLVPESEVQKALSLIIDEDF